MMPTGCSPLTKTRLCPPRGTGRLWRELHEWNPMSFFSFFANRKIGTKITIGFFAILMLLPLFVGTGTSSLREIGKTFSAFDNIMKVVATARAIDQQFTDLRRFVREYASSGNESLIAEAEGRRQKVSASLALAKSIVRKPERIAKLDDIAVRFDAYSNIFSKLVNLKREQMKLISEGLDPIGKTLRLALEDLHVAAGNRPGNEASTNLSAEALKQLMLLGWMSTKRWGAIRSRLPMRPRLHSQR
jgi:CHASE3 domain sensor protein